MFSLFRRSPVTPPPSDTCNDRIRRFWAWFQEVGPSYYATIEEGKCGSLTEPTSKKVDEMFTGFAWVYGPGNGGKGHSFTLSGEGDEHRQLLAIHWLSQAPAIEGWSFHASRQPGPVKGHAIDIHGVRIDPKEIWVTPSIDEEEESIDLTIWHPLWPQIEKRQQWSIVFLFLDEALGEYGSKWWIGEVRLENDRLADSFPLEELPEFVDAIVEREGWKKYPPGESYAMFKIPPADKTFPRSDLVTLTTAVPQLFHDHREAEGKMEDPLENTGADYVYVSFSRDLLPAGKEVDTRYELEEALDNALKPHASGRCIGGGLGRERAYVDLLIFDGQRSLDLIVEVLKARNLPKGTTIEFFAKEKAKNRIRL